MKLILEAFEFDEDYIRRLRAADEAAQAHFIAYFGPLLRIKILRHLARSEDIGNIRDEILTRVLAAIRSEDGSDPPEHLSALVNRVCSDVLDGFQGVLTSRAPLENTFVSKTGDGDSTKDSYARNLVRQVLRGLSTRDQQALRAALVKSREKHEVRDNPDLRGDYVRNLLFRAKRKFLLRYRLLKRPE